MDHINFYKILKWPDGSITFLEYATDVIQTVLTPAKHTFDEMRYNRNIPGPSLRGQNLIWNVREKGAFTTQMASVCKFTQYFNEDEGKCMDCSEN